ncbi:probable calcium-binding protein CML16 [Telopea speciosissima]|uniref:probable calcium-binding protein CML16 n=1 Tax=Telopea speciosissima TaxID=54955 RepID=UPI001CC741C6|nr:probable calcium-binding protein CML16 [Telopea speciosissima]
MTTTTVQANQRKQLREIFGRFDMDSDGSLTLLEFAALLRSLGIKPTGDQIHVLLGKMDSNGNGSVEFEELVAILSPDDDQMEKQEEILINQEQLLEVFRSFDRDGNGYITPAELAGSMAKMGHPLTYPELTEMMREADSNGDGAISFNEFTTLMAKSATDFLGFTL